MSHGDELRFHARGSLAINTRKGRFYDFEAGVGGGPIQLVIHLGAAGTRADALAWLKDRALTPRSFPETDTLSPDRASRASDRAKSLFGLGLPIGGTPAERYLRRRGIDPAQATRLRYVTSAFNVEVGRPLPAMLSPVTRLDRLDELIGVQRTWITPEGAKASLAAPRKLLGSLKGGGVVLSRFERTFLVGEGVETTLSAAALFELPGVATLGAANMIRLVVPLSVETVMIAFDRDASGVGLAAANRLADRLRSEGRRVEVVGPPAGHKDFNSAACGLATP
jgi:hypothetical protein